MYTILLLTALFANPTQFNHLQTDTGNLGFVQEMEDTAKASEIVKPDGVEPFEGMQGYIIGSDMMPWQVSAVSGQLRKCSVIVGTGWTAQIVHNVSFDLFDEDSENGYIITQDIMP